MLLREIPFWERSPVFSLLAASNNKSFRRLILDLVVSSGSSPTKRWSQKSGNDFCILMTAPPPRTALKSKAFLSLTVVAVKKEGRVWVPWGEKDTLGVLQIKAIGFLPKCLNNHSNLTPWGLVPGKQQQQKTFLSSAWAQLIPEVWSNSCPYRWCYLTISSSAYLFSCHQGLFQWNHLFASGGPSIRASASASVLPMNIQGWFPLGLTSLISFLSKGLLRVFSSTFSLVIYFIHSSVCMTYIDFLNFSCLKKITYMHWKEILAKY